jgi:signal transduction histidine kinase
VTSLILIPVILAFIVVDASTPDLRGILGWRIGALVPGVLFLVYALAAFPRLPRTAIVLHAVQLAGLMVMMCGISAELATRPGFPVFGRTGLISSLLVCLFADFALAGGARSWLLAILLPPLAAMGIYVTAAGATLAAMEKVWLISNPAALAIVLSVVGFYQERTSRREHESRTRLRRSEELLRETERRHRGELESLLQRLEFVLAASRTGLDIVDENFVVQYVDPARRASMGDPTGRLCYEYFRAEPGPCPDCAMQRAFSTQTVQVVDQTNPRESDRPTQVTAIPYRGESGTMMVAEVIVDISERKRAEAERLEWERRAASSRRLESLGILAGGVAHHFNNLLTVILGNAELLQAFLPASRSPQACLQEICRAGQQSRDLVLKLLALSRAQPLALQTLDLNLVVRESEPAIRAAIRPEIFLSFSLCALAGPVSVDPERIGEVLLHLALNARDAISGAGRIEISTSCRDPGGAPARGGALPGPWVLLSVTDTGAGMDSETADKVFDPFFTTKEPGKGTGLGLSTVHSIVEQHHGLIEVESHPGAGARFLIYLPLSPLT